MTQPKNPDPLSFGSVVTRLLPKGASVASLAARIGVSYTYFLALMRGVRNGKPIRPSAEMVEKTLAALTEIGADVTPRDRAVLIFSASPVSEASRNLALYGGRLEPFTSPQEALSVQGLGWNALTDDERELLARYRALPDGLKAALHRIADVLKSSDGS